MKKIILGIIISAIFIYISVKGVEFKEIIDSLENVSYQYLIPVIILFLTLSLLRSLRWGVILSPIEKIGQKRLFPINCVGNAAIDLLPMRMGEFVRPYLIINNSRIPFSSAMATVFVERVLDLLTLLLILLIAIFNSSLPSWIVKSGYISSFIFIVMICLMCFLYYKTEPTLNLFRPLFNKLPQKINMRIEELILKFIEGLKIISNPKRLISTLLFSVLIWVFSALAIYNLFLFQNLQLPLLSSFVVLIVLTIGTSLPAAPGLLGNFQFSCIAALAIFDVPKGNALAFSMVFYLFAIGINLLLGLIFLHFTSLSFKEIKRDFNRISLTRK